MRGKYLQILKGGLTEIFRVLATFLALYLFLLFWENDVLFKVTTVGTYETKKFTCSHRRYSVKKVVPKTFSNFVEKHLYWSLILTL